MANFIETENPFKFSRIMIRYYGDGMNASKALGMINSIGTLINKADNSPDRPRQLPHQTMRKLEEKTHERVWKYQKDVQAAIKAHLEQKTAKDRGIVHEPRSNPL